MGYDPFWADVAAVCNMECYDGSVVAPDAVSNSLAVHAAGVSTKGAALLDGERKVKFSGSSSMRLANNAKLNHADGKGLTIEVWINPASLPTAASGSWATPLHFLTDSNQSGWRIWLRNDYCGLSAYWRSNGGAQGCDGAYNFTMNDWTHIAWSFPVPGSGGTGYMFVNGVKVKETANLAGVNAGVTDDMLIGATSGSQLFFNGTIGPWRVTQAQRYTANFTPARRFPTDNGPTYVDTLWANRSLVLDFNGTDGNKSAEGYTPNSAVTFYGNANKSVTQTRGGHKTSLVLPGAAGDKVSIPHNSGFDFGTGDFTVEGWFWIDPAYSHKDGQISCFMAGYQGTASSELGWNCHIYDAGIMRVEYIPSTDSSTWGNAQVTVGPIPKGQWAHFVWQRRNGVAEAAVNGVLYTGASMAGKNVNNPNSHPLQIGNGGSTGTPNYWQFKGFVDSVRITKGVALYTASFTPEYTWPRGAALGTLSGNVTGEDGQPAIRKLAAHRRDTCELLATAMSNAQGNYSFAVPYNGQCYVVCQDDDAGSTLNALIEDRVVPA